MTKILLDRRIGSGRFSKVYLGSFDGFKVAVKVFNSSPSDRKIALNEINILKKIREKHFEHCAELVHHEFASRYFLVLKLYTNAHYSTLLEYINSDTKKM